MVQQSFFPALSADHRRIGDLVMSIKLEQDPAEMERLAEEFQTILRQHFEVEDKVLYPVLYEAVGDWEDRLVLAGAHEEHQIIMTLLHQLPATPTDSLQFRGKVHALDKLWAHHIQDEEDELYAMACKCLDQEQLSDLIRRLREAMAEQGLHDPSRPPG